MIDAKRKRISLTVPAEEYERLREMGKRAGFRYDWISVELSKLVRVLYTVAEQAVKDAEDRRQMTEEEAKKRYEDIARKATEKFF